MGLGRHANFPLYHHVLNRASWSSLKVSCVLFNVLNSHMAPDTGPLTFGFDETVERRRGRQIKAKGIYRDWVRYRKSHFAKTSGLRWISLMWLVPIPWTHRTWTLPIVTMLAHSERYYQKLGKTH